MEEKNKIKDSYKYYLVTYIDIMGQGEEIEKLEQYQFPKENDKGFKKLLSEVHKNTAEFIYNCFRPMFQNYFEEIKKAKESTMAVPKDKLQEFNEMRKVGELKLISFSDCIVAWIPIMQEGMHAQVINGIFGLIGACGGIMLITMSINKRFRAGIEIGLATEPREGEIYGQALNGAYKLERNIAKYPRIIVGKHFKNYLINLTSQIPQTRNQKENDTEYCKKMAESVNKMITKDYDDSMILDYLGKEFQDKFFNTNKEGLKFNELVKKAYGYNEKEHDKWENVKTEKAMKIAERYGLLRNYFKDKCSGIVGE